MKNAGTGNLTNLAKHFSDETAARTLLESLPVAEWGGLPALWRG